MFTGHYGVGFAGQRAAPRVSLGWWFLAVQLVDLLWPFFLLLGWEQVRIHPGDTVMTPLEFRHYPITHSLLGGVGWGLALALLYRALKGTSRDAVWLAAGVVSHWVLDAVVHRPDLPLVPGGATRVGLGLWNHPATEIVVELAVFFAGLVVYLRMTRALGAGGHVSLWSFVLVVLFVHVQQLFGPPPPDERSLALLALTGWLVPPWGFWIDRTRTLINSPPEPSR
jgi:hypothetical protein